jgi:MFS family permease
LALGVVLAGAAVLGSLLLQVTARLIVNYGWRMANVYLAIGILMVGWSFSFLLKPHTPEHYGLKMDGERSGTAIAAGQLGTPLAEKNDVRATEGLSRTEALKTQAFWFMVLAFACRQTALAAVTVHEIPLIQDMGVSPILAAAALGTMTLVSSPGRFIGGWMSDRWNQKYLYVVCSVVQAGGLFLLARATSMSWVWAFVITYGFGYGISMSLEPAMRAAFFGGKAYGTIYGSMQFFTVMGAVFGPYFAGWVYDRSHSYTIAFFTFAMLMFVSAVVILFVRNPMLAKQRKSAAPVP